MRITDLIPWKRRKKTKVPVKVRKEPMRVVDRDAGHPPDQIFRWSGLAPFGALGGRSAVFGPRLDMVEDSEGFKVTMEVPGMEKEDIDVTLSDDRLIVRGARRDKREHRGQGAYSLWRSQEAFRRSIILPCQVDADQTEAEYEDGVLTLRLPKMAEARPNPIEVKVK